MLFDAFKKYRCQHLSFDFAQEPWEQKAYWNLRSTIFCGEQKLFEGHDHDEIDHQAIPIIATATCMGMNDQVVGIVRIDEREPGLWYGSRLGVAKEYRTLSHFQTFHLFKNNVTVAPFTMAVGAALIFKAVSTANAMGCQRFLANVQHQNVSFFERLHWKSLGEITLFGHRHHIMEADLSYYPASAYLYEQTRLTA